MKAEPVEAKYRVVREECEVAFNLAVMDIIGRDSDSDAGGTNEPKKIGSRSFSRSRSDPLGLTGTKREQAKAPTTAYPGMASLDRHLIADRNAEVALARSDTGSTYYVEAFI